MREESNQLHERILVLQCQAGDERAFEGMVRRYGPRLRYYLVKLLGSPEAAEDALQDVWLDVFRGIVRLRDPRAFRAWLYRIAHDRAFRELRRTRKQRALNDEVEPAVFDDSGFFAEDAEQIHRALDTLSEEHREVLMLRFIDDLSYDEIAEATRCSVGTVKSRIHYAKRMLRKTIDEECDSG